MKNLINNPLFIAEIKVKSPFGFVSPYPFNFLVDKAIKYGNWVSVHTDERWGGSFADLLTVRNKTAKPLLAKGFHSTDEQVDKALSLGADYVLIVDRIPKDKYVGRCLLEFSDIKMLEECVKRYPSAKYVYNGRDLKTGKESRCNYDHARYIANYLYGASFIRHPSDIQVKYPLCNGFIVGEHLIEFCSYYKRDNSTKDSI